MLAARPKFHDLDEALDALADLELDGLDNAREDLQTAETVETLSDFRTNLAAAASKLRLLATRIEALSARA